MMKQIGLIVFVAMTLLVGSVLGGFAGVGIGKALEAYGYIQRPEPIMIESPPPAPFAPIIECFPITLKDQTTTVCRIIDDPFTCYVLPGGRFECAERIR
jgi:hypothetical protein